MTSKTATPPTTLDIYFSFLDSLSVFQTFALMVILLMVGCTIISKWG